MPQQNPTTSPWVARVRLLVLVTLQNGKSHPPGTLHKGAGSNRAPAAQQTLLPKEGEGKSLGGETELKSRVKILLGVLSHGECCWEVMLTAPSMGHKIMLLIFLCLLEDDNFVHTGLWGEMGTRI